MSARSLEFQTKVRGYMVIFLWLAILTVVEVALVEAGLHLGWNKLLTGGLVVVFSTAKAALVGWYYMHLNHETTWLKIVALLPLIMVFYAFVLVLEARVAQIPSDYLPLYERAKVDTHHEKPAEQAPKENTH